MASDWIARAGSAFKNGLKPFLKSQLYHEQLLLLQGTALAHSVRNLPSRTPFKDVEFKVFSQMGEDGILQFLLRHVKLDNDFFVEFGVEDYSESNTRFLLMKDNWSGLVIDSSPMNVRAIEQSYYFWKHDLKAIYRFVDRDNIEGILREAGVPRDLGLLSVDIDGNDYWVWEAIQDFRPAIVVCEYNTVFGPEATVTVPYDPAFMRGRAHHSNLYFGASIAALHRLAEAKGYALVGSNSTGGNAFFVREDLANGLPRLCPEEAHVYSRFRDSRGKDGRLTFLRGAERAKAIGDMPLIDVVTGRTIRVRDLGL
jgi:hypothetical protein